MLGFDQNEKCTYTKRTYDETKKSKIIISGVYPFNMDIDPSIRRSALKNNPMSGMTFGRLIRLIFLKEIERWQYRWRQWYNRSDIVDTYGDGHKGHYVTDRVDLCHTDDEINENNCDAKLGRCRKEQGGIEWHLYYHRVIALFFLSLFNSMLGFWELIYMKMWLKNEMKMATDDSQAPVFILGHPRTGTTMLHCLLSLDTRFCVCNTFHAGFPTAFLSFEHLGKRLFANILSETRPMDNMPLSFDLPQEDELATSLLTGGRFSPYISLYFMRDEFNYRKYQTMRMKNDIESGIDPGELAEFVRCFQYFLNKLKCRDVIIQSCRYRKERKSTIHVIDGKTGNVVDSISSFVSHCYRCILKAMYTLTYVVKSVVCWMLQPKILLPPRRLLLKSPCHTGRSELFLKLYPDAKFIYIHRDPFEVFLSSAHMAKTTYGYMFLQKPTDSMLQEYILRQGEILIGEHLRCKSEKILHDKNHVEISFDQLTTRPFETVQYIYEKLDLTSNDEGIARSLKDECSKLKGYKRNKFDNIKLGIELTRTIQTRWRSHFIGYGYDLDRKLQCKKL